ncbi:MAG TPA: hypothetical protein VMY34_03995, partial [Acidimicrobiales bacterium]|nr:hypothetical protein [Acidimicrobiales bacterium]
MFSGSFALLVALIWGITGAVGASAVTGSPPALIELATCAAPTPLPTDSSARTDGATRVSFQVPAIV